MSTVPYIRDTLRFLPETSNIVKGSPPPHPKYFVQQGVPEKREPVVLIVEDEQHVRRLYELGIASWRLPLRLITAKDGAEGLMKASECRPDILITDLHMPGMDGFQMIYRLQRLPQLSTTPLVIVVTSMDKKEIEAQGGLPKNLKVFSKPAPFDLLKECVLDHINFNLQN